MIAMNLSRQLEEELNIQSCVKDIPYIQFKPDWKVKVIFPFGGAAARFRVKSGKADISVYLDTNSVLGCMDEPYYEIYPINGDCERFLLHQHEEMIERIQYAIDSWVED